MCRLMNSGKWRETSMECRMCSAMRVISGAAAAITSSSIPKFNRRIFSGCVAGPAEIDLFSNVARRFVLDLVSCAFAFPNRSGCRYKICGMKISLLLFAALAGASSLLAQEATPPLVPDVPHSQTIMDTVINAGPVMIPLFLLSIFSVALVIVYLMTIRRCAGVSSGYMATADALLRKRDYLGLLAVSNRHGEAIARVVQKILDFTHKNPHADFQQVREIAETEGSRVAASLNNPVLYLALI